MSRAIPKRLAALEAQQAKDDAATAGACDRLAEKLFDLSERLDGEAGPHASPMMYVAALAWHDLDAAANALKQMATEALERRKAVIAHWRTR